MCAVSTTTAPPREWPMRIMGGSLGQESWLAVECRMNERSEASVGRVRSRGSVGGEVV